MGVVVRRCAVLFLFAGCASTSATIVDGGADAGADAGSCHEISARAQAELEDAQAQAANELACNADRDCVLVYELRFCGDQPCEVHLFNEAGASFVWGAIEQINTTTCTPFYDARCPRPQPPCGPPASDSGPYCNAGRCSSTPPPDASDGG